MAATSDETPQAAAKRALRTRVVAARDRLSDAERAALSAAVTARFAELPEVRAARTLLCFVSFDSEVDTLPLLTWAIDAGKVVAAPRVTGRRTMEARRITDPARDLEEGRFGIRAPRAELPLVRPQDLDVIVVPGSAFTADGARMGYGGGYYDTYLQRAAAALRVAPAFELQIVTYVPREPHDLAVDVIVTEKRVLRTLRNEPC